MEQKSVLLSALGVGVGLGIGLASGQSLVRWANGSGPVEDGLTGEQIEQGLLKQILNGRESTVTFDEFPYFLSERTRELLTSAAYVHLKGSDISKHTKNLVPANKAILLSGPAEFYQQTLAKALSHYFESKLLLLDVNDFSIKMQSKYGCTMKEPFHKRSFSELTLNKMSSLMGSFSMLSQSKVDPRASSKESINLCFDEKLFMQSIYKVLVSVSDKNPLIIYLRDVEKLLESERFYKLLQKLLNKLSGPVLILGSRVLESGDDYQKVSEGTSSLFPYNIEIRPPEDESQLKTWKNLLEDDMKKAKFQENKNHIGEFLSANDIKCDDLASICQADTMCLSNHIEEVVVSAITYHLIHTKEPEYRNGKLVISSKSLSHGLSIFKEGGTKSSEDSPKDNEFEEGIRSEVIKANEIGVTFADIGSLDETKELLQELVMLPLRRPDLFKGSLLKPCRGILLFGPPGSGKTMLAKAIANEAGASFINVSMSTISSMWFGDNEKNVRALFTLAAKVSPTIIFVDEVDSMLGQRTRDGEESTRKMKNEFMSHWDGLMSKPGERILVLAATNRPFDLDEAIIRRFERRIMVGLPSIESREKILRTLLSKEKTDALDFHELGKMTEGYSGSDLKNMCITAAYRPVRELIQQERLKDQVATSFASEGSGMDELKRWNDLYGEGGSRKKEHLTYFL
ncbi:P-loop containing nucleoside triphosphate hydrolases superfamily protein [Raphanus sativus]|nr:P-loop containing nucleoside triphosphate hydrolases superfamily protein [Raphanus sativus]